MSSWCCAGHTRSERVSRRAGRVCARQWPAPDARVRPKYGRAPGAGQGRRRRRRAPRSAAARVRVGCVVCLRRAAARQGPGTDAHPARPTGRGHYYST
eukprot:scaffold5660_cov323-Prasinococcus_capsulatus_cf.AAC.5